MALNKSECAYEKLQTGSSIQSSKNTTDLVSQLKARYLSTLVGAVLLFLLGGLLGNYVEALVSEMSCGDGPSSDFYKTGFPTEQLLPPDAIALEFKTFSGNPFFLPNGSEVLAFDPTQPMYVGQPSKEMDHAWSQMLFARYFNLTAHEAQQVWGDQYLEYRNPNDGSFSGGFDVFHGLHCLNELRKRLRPDYYEPTKLHGRVHDMHCIDHLRQTLQCSAVASIIPSRYRPNVGFQYSDAAQPHVCRDFDRILNHTRRRFYDGPHIEP